MASIPFQTFRARPSATLDESTASDTLFGRNTRPHWNYPNYPFTAPTQVLQTPEKTEDIDPNIGDIICPVCLDPYLEPKTLNCGHSLCATCANHMVRQADFDRSRRLVNGVDPTLAALQICCPTCREMTNVPETRKLPTNYGMIDVLNKFKALHPGEEKGAYKTCTSCQQKSKEEHFWHCKTCSPSIDGEIAPSWICANCALKFHPQPKHVIMELATLKHKVQIERGRIEVLASDVRSKIEQVEHGAKALLDTSKDVVQILESQRHKTMMELLSILGGAKGANVVSDSVLHKTREQAAQSFGSIEKLCEAIIDSQKVCTRNLQEKLHEFLSGYENQEMNDIAGTSTSAIIVDSKKRKKGENEDEAWRELSESQSSGLRPCAPRKCTYGVRRNKGEKMDEEEL